MTKQDEFKTLKPSTEQRDFIAKAKAGNNVFVDACIGSGKTTAIQKLCQSLPNSKRVLYLTYNRLLKIDAQNKITQPNVYVQNYHGFAYMALANASISSGVSDLIQNLNIHRPSLHKYDVLILDEYQDIDEEIADMLEYIKECNPNIQIIAVGDMRQKIYDKTTLDVITFIHDYLGIYEQVDFTQCFRLSEAYAAKLGRIWNKNIIGVNPDCEIETMKQSQIVAYLAEQDPSQIICLGARVGGMSKTLNALEQYYPDKYNKHTVYASIFDRRTGAVSPKSDSAIFTTFDSSKGMERDICVIFDYDTSYWQSRIRKPQQKYEILRNIFLVAASRGKKKIIYVQSDKTLLDEQVLSKPVKMNETFGSRSVADLFAFKYKEDIESAYKELTITRPERELSVIETHLTDALIDLTPCINYHQQAYYFTNYNIDLLLDMAFKLKYKSGITDIQKQLPLDDKILLLTSVLTNQGRYKYQVETPFMDETAKHQVAARIATELSPDTRVLTPITYEFVSNGKSVLEVMDHAPIETETAVYTMKYGDEITHTDSLECAMYMIALGYTKGVVWNIRTNEQVEITIKHTKRLLNKILKTATKGTYRRAD